MFTRKELLSSPEYWFEDAQNTLFRELVTHLEKEEISQSELATRLGVTKGYVSQILKGNFNYTLKKLIEISLAIGMVPRVTYTPIDKVLEKENRRKLQKAMAAEPRKKYKRRSRNQ